MHSVSKNPEMDIDIIHVVKQKLVLTCLSFLLSALSFVPLAFMSEDDDLIAIISLLAVGIFGLLGCIFYFSISPYRKMYQPKSRANKTSSKIFDSLFGIRRTLFSNKYSVVTDIIFIICLVISYIILDLDLPFSIEFSWIFFSILSMELHSVLNGKNFKFFLTLRKAKPQ
jgi:hypothetical protein